MRIGAIRLIGQQEFHHAFTGFFCAGRGRVYHHAFGRCADTRSRKHALALDLDHTCTAVAVATVPGFIGMTEVRDLRTIPLSHFPDALAGFGRYFFSVKGEGCCFEHSAVSSHIKSPPENASSLIGSGSVRLDRDHRSMRQPLSHRGQSEARCPTCPAPSA